MAEIKESLEVTKLFHEIMSLLRNNITKGFEDLGITMPQGMVIACLGKNGSMKISELSSKMGFSNSTASGIIDRLEKQKIVKRVRSEEDKRVVYVSLCEGFGKMHKDFHKRMEETLVNILSKGTNEELGEIINGLNALKKLLQTGDVN